MMCSAIRLCRDEGARWRCVTPPQSGVSSEHSGFGEANVPGLPLASLAHH